MKSFEMPVCEIIHFGSGIISTSTCGCFDGEDEWPRDCKGDMGYCECTVNYDPALANCICASFTN